MFETRAKVTPAHLKRHNETLILRAIYGHESISRVQLANLTNLSRPSVTELTQGLIRRGLVMEVGPEQVLDKVGKKPTLLAFKPDAFQIVAAAIGDTTLTGSLLDLRMRIIKQHVRPLDGATGPALVALLIDVIRSLMVYATRPVLGIALGTPGIVDSSAGFVHLASNLKWSNLPLADHIAEKIDLPVFIGNDSALAATGEYRYGMGQGIDDLIVLKIGVGIGAGILAGGRLIHGHAYGAGEFGHTPFPNLDYPCVCGRRGCLETVVSMWGIVQRARDLASKSPYAVGQDAISFETIVQELAQNDPVTVELVRRSATQLGQALITAIHLLNPRRIILMGSMLNLGDIFLDQLREIVKERAFAYIAAHTDIVPTYLGDNSILFGAGAMLLGRELGL